MAKLEGFDKETVMKAAIEFARDNGRPAQELPLIRTDDLPYRRRDNRSASNDSNDSEQRTLTEKELDDPYAQINGPRTVAKMHGRD